MPKRRNLSGIYIFEKFEGEKKEEPTCFEDCTEETQKEWLDSKGDSPEFLKSLALKLGQTIRNIGDHFDIIAGEEE